MSQDILHTINCPADVKKLSVQEIKELSAQCRQEIIATVSKNGGHLASNLGVVELTLALAKVFDFEEGRDRLIFDVGHQCYTWKLITGRREAFAGLRQENGISGFPKREESPYDFFNTGHSSTSISAALGYARADRIRQQSGRKNIALIGDGAMTGGMAFEALNDAGQRGDPILVILNDNEMSIDGNVGGLSRYLEDLRISNGYRHFKKVVKARMDRHPQKSAKLMRWLENIKGRARLVGRQSGAFFEELGFRYYGPVDGHDLDSLIRHLRACREREDPVLLHVLTCKGLGYRQAEDEPSKYHGVAPFLISKGVQPKSGGTSSFTQLAGRYLLEKAEADQRIVAISAAMTSGCGLSAFAQKLPERFFDVGISEQHAATLAAGLAAGGLRPVLALYSTFLQRAVDQVLHDICLQNLPVTILLDHAGLVSHDGETHQGIYDLALLGSLPNLELLAPADAADVEACLDYALSRNGPTVLRYPKDSAPEALPFIGQRSLFGLRKLREGKDLNILAYGATAEACLEAAEILLNSSYSSAVYSYISGKNIHLRDMIGEEFQSRPLILVTEGVRVQSPSLTLVDEYLHETPELRLKLIAVEDCLAPQGSRKELLERESLSAAGIARKVLDWLARQLPESE